MIPNSSCMQLKFPLMPPNPQFQHRCVFVGNIPYDATEEQLVQICEEVGPVVSFRLVIDRETGKPKGYGFCEYKDGETAASARRNLQGYEINGRQLRVHVAENDKNADRNHDQGRGGPGVSANVDAQKQIRGPAVLGNPSVHQPIGDSIAMDAATVMKGALGYAQIATSSNETGLPNQSLLGTDPLTCHLAKMSKSQLTEVVSELKAIATQNNEQARQLLLAFPNLPKALFQAQIMLGLVTPQMVCSVHQILPSWLQMPNIKQSFVQPLVQNAQTLPGLPPLPKSKTQLGVLPYAQETRVTSGVSDQYAALQKLPTQVQIQRPQLTQNQQGPLLAQSGVSPHPSIHPQPLSGLPVGQLHTPTSSSFNQHPLPQNVTPVPPINSVHSDRRMSQNVSANTSMLIHPQYSVAGFQLSSSASHVMPETMNLKRHASTVTAQTNQMENRASKMVKLNDGRPNPSPHTITIATPLSAPFPTTDLGRQASRIGATINPEKQATQVQLPADVDLTLLEQLMNLTPEQLRALPPEQQQQVIQLQQMLRQGM